MYRQSRKAKTRIIFRRLLVLSGLWCSVQVSFSQSTTPEVIGSGGGSILTGAGAYRIDYNIGEMAIQTGGTNPLITEGFEQPEMGEVSLPVQDLDLQTTNVNNHALLRFSTVQEFKSAHFIVERSLDSKTFDTASIIQTKAVNGYSTTPLNYRYTDPRPLQSKVYFRIRQVDQNGDFSYSPIRSVSPNTANGLKVFPSPATSQIEVHFEQNTPAGGTRVQVYSAAGTLMYNKVIYGTTQTTIVLDKWASGVYIIVSESKGSLQTTKFIKK